MLRNKMESLKDKEEIEEIKEIIKYARKKLNLKDVLFFAFGYIYHNNNLHPKFNKVNHFKRIIDDFKKIKEN